MEWADDAIVLTARRYGEAAVILEVLTRMHGRHLGLVHGGASRRLKAALQPGNSLRVKWRARLSENLGEFSAELVHARIGEMLDDRDALTGLGAFAEIARAALPERELHKSIFEASEILLDAIAAADFAHWGPLYVRWETGLLEALGFGLDLSRCAATGSLDDLFYVSPKSGRAVSREAGAPYRERLFALPSFLLASQNASPTAAEIAAGMALTGYFILDRVLHPHGRKMPEARLRLDALANRESA
jgi:DNA repair protein RecO (recombination protein O)